MSTIRKAVMCIIILCIAASSHAQVLSRIRLTHNGDSYTRSGLGWNSRGDRVAYLKQDGHGGRQIYISNPDGSGAKPVSPPGWTANYNWSPDGNKIAYPYAESWNVSRDTDMFVYDVGTGKSKEIASNFTWSQFEYLTGYALQEWTSDNKEFTMLMGRYQFPSDKQIDAVSFDIETGAVKNLTISKYTTGYMYPGTWSPDNEKFAYIAFSKEGGRNQIFVCSRDGSCDKAITLYIWGIDSDPRWSPNSDWIAFAKRGNRLEGIDTTRIVDLWVTNSEGMYAHRLTTGSDLDSPGRMSVSRPEWTADGRYIVVQTTKYNPDLSKYRGIYLVDVQTGELTRVIEDVPGSGFVMKNYEDKIVLSPDGRRIAILCQEFSTGKTGQDSWNQEKFDVLYYFDIPTKKLHEIERVCTDTDEMRLHMPYCGWNPDWSPDGNKLLVTRAGNTNRTLTPDVYVYELAH